MGYIQITIKYLVRKNVILIFLYFIILYKKWIKKKIIIMTVYLRILFLEIKSKIHMAILDHFVLLLHFKIRLILLWIILKQMINLGDITDSVMHTGFMNNNNFL